MELLKYKMNILLSDRDPFGAKAWQEFLNQFGFLAEHGLTVDDVRETIALEKREQEEQIKNMKAEAAKTLKKCPQCSYPLQLLPVNDTPATQTGDNSKSVWLCRRCYYEKFSDKTVSVETQNLASQNLASQNLASQNLASQNLASLQPIKTGE